MRTIHALLLGILAAGSLAITAQSAEKEVPAELPRLMDRFTTRTGKRATVSNGVAESRGWAYAASGTGPQTPASAGAKERAWVW